MSIKKAKTIKGHARGPPLSLALLSFPFYIQMSTLHS